MWPFKTKEFGEYFNLRSLSDSSIDLAFRPRELRIIDALDRFYFGNIKDGESVLGNYKYSSNSTEQSFLLRLALLSARDGKPFVPRIQSIPWRSASSSRAMYALFPGDVVVRCYVRREKVFLAVTNKHFITRTILAGWLSDSQVLGAVYKLAEQKRSSCCSPTERTEHVV